MGHLIADDVFDYMCTKTVCFLIFDSYLKWELLSTFRRNMIRWINQKKI